MSEIVKLVDALAWPITVIILAFSFRRVLSPPVLADLIRRIRIIKAGNFEISLDETLRKAEEKVATLPRTTSQNEYSRIDQVELDVSDTLSRVADRSPRAAVIEAWLEIERAVLEAARGAGAVEPERRSTYKVMLDLVRTGVITQEFLDVFNYLREIRNKVIHSIDAEVDTLESERYIELATDLSVQIKRAGRRLPHNIPLNPDTHKNRAG